jgi:prepilin-type processing-associated H-X9-DG protein
MSETGDENIKRVCKRKGGLKGSVYAILAVVSVIVILVSLVLINLPARRRKPDSFVCLHNMSILGNAIYMYTSDYDGQYPNADKWCDLLVMNYEVKLEYLVCKGSDAKIGESSYALNKNIAGKNSSEIPENTVLLFETNFGKDPLGRDGTLGDRDWYTSLSSLSDRSDLKKHKHSEKVYKLRWNQFGGSELLTTDNHKGEGCNVLFNDLHVEFIKTERLGELKWDVEEKDSGSIE